MIKMWIFITKENGNIIRNLEKEKNSTSTWHIMKEITLIIGKMAMANTFIQMGLFMEANLKMTKEMEKELYMTKLDN